MSFAVNLWLLIAGMAVLTYLPRLIPALFIQSMHFSGRFKKFLRLLPYTVMTALIIPGIFSTDPEHPAIGLGGGICCILLSIFKVPIGLNVLLTILACWLMYQLQLY